MTKKKKVKDIKEINLGEAFAEAANLCEEKNRPDLAAKLFDEFYLLMRFPFEQYPDGPPQETVDNMRKRREEMFPERKA